MATGRRPRLVQHKPSGARGQMMVRQLADHHLAFWQNVLCDKELLKRAEPDDGLARARPPVSSSSVSAAMQSFLGACRAPAELQVVGGTPATDRFGIRLASETACPHCP